MAVATFCVSVSWLAGGLGGATYWFWSQWLPKRQPGDRDLAELLHWNISESALELVLGVIALLLWPLVLRVCVAAQVGLARALLGNQRLRHLQDRVETLTLSRAAAVQAEADALRGLGTRHPRRSPAAAGPAGHGPLGGRTAFERRSGSGAQAAGRRPRPDRRGSGRTAGPVARHRAADPGRPRVGGGAGLRRRHQSPAGRPGPRRVWNRGRRRWWRARRTSSSPRRWPTRRNTARPSTCTCASARLRDTLSVEVEDDGVGGAHPGKGHGLAGLAARLGAVDGRLDVVSPAGGPTRLRAEIPCA